MKRTALFLAALALAACDSDSEEPADARIAELDLEDADADDTREHHGRHEMRRHRDRAAELCQAVSCTDAQAEQVQSAFAPPERGERPERPDMSEANATLSKAFASETFAASDLEAWAAQLPERPERGQHHLDTLSELHTILTAEQRTALADKITAGEFFGPRHHGKRSGEKDHAHKVERFCEALECTDAQQTQLTEIFETKHAKAEHHESRRAAVAAAFAADSFDADALAASMKPDPTAKHDVLVALHGVLTPEQRATLAERIAERGPRGILGKHGRHGKHRRGRDGHPEHG